MTYSTLNLTIIFFITIFITGLSGYIIWRFLQRRWKCTEAGCEQNITGKYKSKAECNKQCKNIDSVLDNTEDKKITTWACTSEYDCIPAKEGKFVSKEACQKFCIQPQNTQYYYPQTLIPWYLNRRPHYWSYRQFSRPIRHGKRLNLPEKK